ncbi:endolytic transglycosylase MltG [Actinomycetospora sp. CA-084318]|uniref:endolytic transglycosylase MltG n=1 Tax=Actinomycetospora sp. CA-084318 TaxID=3239892 RepID=UPI003D97B151
MTRGSERPRLVPMSSSRGADQHEAPGHDGDGDVRIPRRSRGLRRPGEPPADGHPTRRRDWEAPTTALAAPDDDDAVTDTLRHGHGPEVPARVTLPRPPDRSRRHDVHREQPTHPVPASAARASWTPAEPTAPTTADDARRSSTGDLDVLGGLVPGAAERAPQERPARRRLVWPAVAAVLVLALAGGAFFARDLWGVVFPPDFDGPGSGHVVVQVADGDSTRDIGESLVTAGVVASARGFGQAAEDDPRGRGIQPGYYDMARQMSAAGAVTRMLDPASRLGRLEVRGGTQLDDTAGVGASRVPGVLSLISEATCAVDDAGRRTCVSVDDLRRTMADTDPAQLGVPDWALEGARRAPPERRLEGLVAPGTYDVRPGSDAVSALTTVVRTSAETLESAGLVTKAAANDVTPYQALIVGSIAEREGIESDFRRITRVVYNRLPIPMRLQMDSTINYPLDRQTLLTTPVDRAAPGPYNTYLNFGLPPTPIGAVSTPALTAALNPEVGGWVYFVKCEKDGASCFAVTPEEHDANRRLAQARGVY